MKDEFIFKGIEGNQARVGLVISPTEVHDFLMAKEKVLLNRKSFKFSSVLKEAGQALSAESPTGFLNVC